MTSSMILSNKKDKYLFIQKTELLFEFGKILNQIWKSYQLYEKKTDYYLSLYFFALKEIEKQNLDIELPNNILRIYLDKTEYNFEVENC